MKRASKRKWSLDRILLLLVISLVFATASLAVFLRTYGVPDWILSQIANDISDDHFSFEPTALTVDLADGVNIKDVRVFRKGVVGPPVADVSELDVEVNFVEILLGRSGLRSLTLKNAVFNSQMCSGLNGVQSSSVPNLGLEFGIRVDNCIADGLAIKNLKGTVWGMGSHVGVENMKASFPEPDKGEMSQGSIFYDFISKDIKGRIEAALDPHTLLPLVERIQMPFLAKLIRRFVFDKSLPRYEVDFSRNTGAGEILGLDGRVWLSDCMYRDVNVLRADGHVKMEMSTSNTLFRLDPLLIIRREGNLEGTLKVDLNEHKIEYDAVSSIEPIALLKMIGVYNDEIMSSWRFNGPVRVSSTGKANYDDISKRDIKASVKGVDMGIDRVIAQEGRCNLRINNEKIDITDAVGKIYGGTFTGNAGIILADGIGTNVVFNITAQVNKVNAGELMNALGKEMIKNFSGDISLDGRIKGTFSNNCVNIISGNGRVNINNGKVFSLPVFGGLSELMKKIIPGLDFVLRQSDLKSDYVIANGKIHSDKILIEGDILSLNGSGDYYMDSKKLDYGVQLKLLKAHTVAGKLMRVITYPISKLFEFRLRGDINNPRWYPVNFSTDLLEEIGFKKTEDM